MDGLPPFVPRPGGASPPGHLLSASVHCAAPRVKPLDTLRAPCLDERAELRSLKEKPGAVAFRHECMLGDERVDAALRALQVARGTVDVLPFVAAVQPALGLELFDDLGLDRRDQLRGNRDREAA